MRTLDSLGLYGGRMQLLGPLGLTLAIATRRPHRCNPIEREHQFSVWEPRIQPHHTYTVPDSSFLWHQMYDTRMKIHNLVTCVMNVLHIRPHASRHSFHLPSSVDVCALVTGKRDGRSSSSSDEEEEEESLDESEGRPHRSDALMPAVVAASAGWLVYTAGRPGWRRLSAWTRDERVTLEPRTCKQASHLSASLGLPVSVRGQTMRKLVRL